MTGVCSVTCEQRWRPFFCQSCRTTGTRSTRRHEIGRAQREPRRRATFGRRRTDCRKICGRCGQSPSVAPHGSDRSDQVQRTKRYCPMRGNMLGAWMNANTTLSTLPGGCCRRESVSDAVVRILVSGAGVRTRLQRKLQNRVRVNAARAGICAKHQAHGRRSCH